MEFTEKRSKSILQSYTYKRDCIFPIRLKLLQLLFELSVRMQSSSVHCSVNYLPPADTRAYSILQAGGSLKQFHHLS